MIMGRITNPHQSWILYQIFAAIVHSTKRCGVDSIASLQTEKRRESLSIPRASKFKRVGNRSLRNLHEWMFILIGRVLFHFTLSMVETKVEESIAYRMEETVYVLRELREQVHESLTSVGLKPTSKFTKSSNCAFSMPSLGLLRHAQTCDERSIKPPLKHLSYITITPCPNKCWK